TAALDARAEQEVFEKIRALADSGQTVVLITHRLASVRHADLVHVLDHGRLVESGTPDELLATGGLYAELYALQAEQFAKAPASARKQGRNGTPPTSSPRTPTKAPADTTAKGPADTAAKTPVPAPESA
ncbi:ABC transporter ATP-binding protein/permease, partial [Streptomyces sp. TRM76130]|nr:ABC transporter ATP-binding protein/permease [Streptomyces sp. TRM76130]